MSRNATTIARAINTSGTLETFYFVQVYHAFANASAPKQRTLHWPFCYSLCFIANFSSTRCCRTARPPTVLAFSILILFIRRSWSNATRLQRLPSLQLLLVVYTDYFSQTLLHLI